MSSLAARADRSRIPSHRWPVSIRLYLASFLVVGLALSVLGPALTQLRERSGAGIGGIGVLFVGQSIGYIVGSLAGGRLYDRFDGHRVFATALGIVSVGFAMLPLFDGLIGLFAAFLIIGLGASAADLGANTLLMWQLGAGSARAMNLLHLCFGFGALMAPLVVHVGLDAAGVTVAAFCVVLAVWATTIPSPTPPRSARRRAHGDDEAPAGVVGRLLLHLRRPRDRLRRMDHDLRRGDRLQRVDRHLVDHHVLDQLHGRTAAGECARRSRAPERVLAVASVASIAAALVLIGGHGRPPAVWAGTVMMGIATAPQFPGMVMMAERRIQVTGSATAWFVGGAGCGGLVYPWVIGQFFDAAGETALPWAVLALAVATFGVFAAAVRALGGGSRR